MSSYARLLEILKSEDIVENKLGLITSTRPFKLQVGDLEVDKDNLLLNPILLYEENLLEIGDQVFIERINGKFLLVCKVVDFNG